MKTLTFIIKVITFLVCGCHSVETLSSVSSEYYAMPKSGCEIIHEGQRGGPCTVCQCYKDKYWHIAQSEAEKNSHLIRVLRERNVGDDQCVCHACKKSVLKGRISGSGRKRSLDDSLTCTVPGCLNSEILHRTSKVDIEAVVKVFQVDLPVGENITSGQCDITLCHKHYCALKNFQSKSIALFVHRLPVHFSSKMIKCFLTLSPIEK